MGSGLGLGCGAWRTDDAVRRVDDLAPQHARHAHALDLLRSEQRRVVARGVARLVRETVRLRVRVRARARVRVRVRVGLG